MKGDHAQHPLWPAFLALDRRQQCGVPDMEDDGDRMKWETFRAGAERATATMRTHVSEALERAEANVALHVGREVFEKRTAEAVMQEYRDQLGELLGSPEETKGGANA